MNAILILLILLLLVGGGGGLLLRRPNGRRWDWRPAPGAPDSLAVVREPAFIVAPALQHRPPSGELFVDDALDFRLGHAVGSLVVAAIVTGFLALPFELLVAIV